MYITELKPRRKRGAANPTIFIFELIITNSDFVWDRVQFSCVRVCVCFEIEGGSMRGRSP